MYEVEAIKQRVVEMDARNMKMEDMAKTLNELGFNTVSGKPWTGANVSTFRRDFTDLKPRLVKTKVNRAKKADKQDDEMKMNILRKVCASDEFTNEEIQFFVKRWK